MKIIITLAAIMAAFTSPASAQSLDEQMKPYEFTIVEKVDVHKADIIKYAQTYFTETLDGGKDAIQLADPERGQLIGDIVLIDKDAGFLSAFRAIRTRVVIDSKDGRFRLRGTNIQALSAFDDPDGVAVREHNRESLQPMTDKLLTSFATGLKEYLEKTRKNADW